MKHLLLSALLMAGGAAHGQNAPGKLWGRVRGIDAYCVLPRDTRVFEHFSDTATASGVVLAKGTRLFVMKYASPRWAVCNYEKKRKLFVYIVSVATLGPYETEPVDAQ